MSRTAPIGVHIARTAYWAPPTVETAAALAPRIGRSAEWILARTGILERRISKEPMDAMAARVVREVCPDGPPDVLINASLTPIQLIPDSSIFILRELGWTGVPSFSVHSTCLSFLVGLQQAAGLIGTGQARRVVVVSSEQGSVSRDPSHPESAALIGDGAAVALVTATPAGSPSALLGLRTATFPEFADLAELRGCGTSAHPNEPTTTPSHNLFQMRGPRIYKAAVPRVAELVGGLLRDLDMTPDDIDWLVPHQASGPGVAAMTKLGVDASRIVDIVARHGNMIAASLPTALAHHAASGKLKRGQRILLVGTGAGLVVGAAVLVW